MRGRLGCRHHRAQHFLSERKLVITIMTTCCNSATSLVSFAPFHYTNNSHTHCHSIFIEPRVPGRAGIINPILEINYTDGSLPSRLQRRLAGLENQVFHSKPVYSVWQLLTEKGENRVKCLSSPRPQEPIEKRVAPSFPFPSR